MTSAWVAMVNWSGATGVNTSSARLFGRDRDHEVTTVVPRPVPRTAPSRHGVRRSPAGGRRRLDRPSRSGRTCRRSRPQVRRGFLIGRHRQRQGETAIGRPHAVDRCTASNDGTDRSPELAWGRNRSSTCDHSIIRDRRRRSTSAASGADAATVVRTSDDGDRADDEDGATAQVQAGQVARVADPATGPVRLLVEGVEPDEQEQRRERVEDEVPQLHRARSLRPCWR